MKKINYGSFVCEVSVDPDYMLLKHGLCDYERDTIAYAVESFFRKSKRFCRECTLESWQIRTAKSKERVHKFSYVIPASLMELPGNWVRLTGNITATGVQIWKIELLIEHPCFRTGRGRG